MTEDKSPVRAPLPTATFVTEVVRVETIGHPFVRITFGGGDLERFRSIGPDQFVYVLLPPPGRSDLTIDSSFSWDEYRRMPEEARPVGAYYTVRHHRPDSAEIDVDVVLHDAPGPASMWAAAAEPGAAAALWGPRTAYGPPPDTSRRLLVGDETALPAIAAILEAEPTGAVTVIVEVDRRTVVDLPWIAGLEVTSIQREPGVARGSLLLEAISSRSLPTDVYAWGGGEHDAIGAIRDYLRNDLQLPPAQVSMVGYWRQD